MSRAVIVTGASHGIGRAAAVLFARKGYSTVINYHRSESEALSLARSLTQEAALFSQCRRTFPTLSR